MLSDNASTYLSAADELHDLFSSTEIKDLLAEHRVTWTFIPKRAPWYGGFWERLIGLTKTTIKKVFARYNREMLYMTLLIKNSYLIPLLDFHYS